MKARSLPEASIATAPTFSLEVWGATDRGQLARVNEDTIWPEGAGTPLPDGSYLLLVADGVGGAQAGEVASRIAMNEIVKFCQNISQPDNPVQILEQAVQAANTAVHNYVLSAPTVSQAASTVVVALVKKGQANIANVGDSRAYLIRKGAAEQLTQDHTLTQQKVDWGHLLPEQAATDEDRNIITRSLGSTPTVQVDINSAGVRPLQPGDTLLLCSDGLTDVLSDLDIARLAAGPKPQAAVNRLISAANRRGGPDNISVVLGRAPGPTTRFPLDWPHLLLGVGGVLLLLACILLLGGFFLSRPSNQAVTQATPLSPETIGTMEPVTAPANSTSVTPTPSTLEPASSDTVSPAPTLFATSTPLPTAPPFPASNPFSTPESNDSGPIFTPTPELAQPSRSPIPVSEPPEPTLTDPPNGTTVSGGEPIEFKWIWNENLGDGAAFEIRLWYEEDSENYSRRRYSSATPGLERQHDKIYVATLSIDGFDSVQQHGSGLYHWTVIVVNLETGQSISPEAAFRQLRYR